MQKKIANTLLLLGIPINHLGYPYLKEALSILVNDSMAIHSMGKSIYIPVAEKFDTTDKKVERAFRHSIESAHATGTEFYSSFFIKKPTNSEFLAYIAEKLRWGEI